VSDVEAALKLSPQEERGRELYEKTCAGCHGGANKATIVDRHIHDLAFPALKPDGTVLFEVPATDSPTPVLAAQPDNEFINIGSAMENFLVQIGATEHESFTKDVSFPAYRFRFYKDASRAEIVADLPPALPPGGPTLHARALSVTKDSHSVARERFAAAIIAELLADLPEVALQPTRRGGLYDSIKVRTTNVDHARIAESRFPHDPGSDRRPRDTSRDPLVLGAVDSAVHMHARSH
jgi:hypothetical protein